MENKGENIHTDVVNLFGYHWDTRSDKFSSRVPMLDHSANTKRLVLKSLNSNFDPIGINLPIFNRAKLFLQKLQSDANLSWDSPISQPMMREWENICRQLNVGGAKLKPISRCFGKYSDKYDLIGFCDASNEFIGCVLYIFNRRTDRMNFLQAKNKLVSRNLKRKSMPVLELIAVRMGVELVQNIFSELCRAFCPINISNVSMYTDSMIVFCRLNSKSTQCGKIERKGPMINNALDKICTLCKKKSINFHHIVGKDNVSDLVTRCISPKILSQSLYHVGRPKYWRVGQ